MKSLYTIQNPISVCEKKILVVSIKTNQKRAMG